MSSFINFVNHYSIKSVFSVFLLAIIVCGNWYLCEVWKPIPPPRERCSSSYPQSSVILDHWVILPNGNIQAGGVVYPLEATWMSHGIVRACPCSISPCLQRCCPENMVLPENIKNNSLNEFDGFENVVLPESITNNTLNVFDGFENIEITNNHNSSENYTDYSTFYDEKGEDYLEEMFDPTNNQVMNTPCVDINNNMQINWTSLNIRMNKSISRNHFSIFGPQCSNIEYQKDLQHKLLLDGRIWSEHSQVYMDVTEVCYDLRDFQVYSCVSWNSLSVETGERELFILNVWHNIFLLFAIVIHIVTVAAFILVPHLRKGYGSPVLCFVLSQLLRKVVIVLPYFVGLMETSKNFSFENLLVSLEYFTDLSSQFWQAAIAHQIWTAFRPGRVFQPTNSKSQFKIYCAIAWGIPVFLTSLRGTWTEDTLLANIGHHLRDFGSLLPALIAEVICMVLCAATVWGVRSWQQGSKMRGEDSQRHNAKDVHWSLIFLKVTMITGVDYILVTTILIIKQGYFWPHTEFKVPRLIFEIPSDINNLRGVEVFLIFVLKVDVWNSLHAKFGHVWQFSSSSQGTAKKSVTTKVRSV